MENSLYFFLSSDDSKNYHPENSPHSFTIELPERLELNGNWEVSLSDINIKDTFDTTLYIYSDVGEYSYVNNSMEPILRVIYPSSYTKRVFSTRYYIPVRSKNLGRISVYIRDRNGSIPQNFLKNIELTLHLRKNYGYVQ